MDFGRFFHLVTTRERGLAQQRRLKAIWEVAAASIGCAVDRVSQFEAQVLVEKILQVQKEIKDTQQLIETINQQFKEYHLLLTIPGFGPYVASLGFSSHWGCLALWQRKTSFEDGWR